MERLLNTYSGVAVVFFHNFRQSAMRIASGKQFLRLVQLRICVLVGQRLSCLPRRRDAINRDYTIDSKMPI